MIKLSKDEVKFLADLDKQGPMALGFELNYWASNHYAKEKLKRLAGFGLVKIENNLIYPIKQNE
jgi:hypothetical protein